MKRVLKFIAYITIAGIFGGTVAFFIIHARTGIDGAVVELMNLLKMNIVWIQYGIGVVLGLFILNQYFKTLHMEKKQSEEIDDETGELEVMASRVLILNALNITMAFTLYGIVMGSMIDENTPASVLLPSINAFLAVTLFGAFMEAKTYKILKRSNPQRKGDPLSLRFGRDWMDSGDEAEKYAAYRSSYQSITFMKYAIMALFIILTFLNLVVKVGPAAFAVLGIVFMLQTVSYETYYMRIAKKRM